MGTLPIPYGWYELEPDDTILDGDLFFNKYTHNQWYNVSCLTESKVRKYQDAGFFIIVIRRGTTQKPDKEWVNPWD